MWKSINQLVGRNFKTTHISSLKIGEEEVSDETQIANTLNTYFTNVGPNLANQMPRSNIELEVHKKRLYEKFSFNVISINEVLDLLNQLNTSKALGPDKIPATLLKAAKDVIASYLTHIYNLMYPCSRAITHRTGKWHVFHLSINQVTKRGVVITGQYLF